MSTAPTLFNRSDTMLGVCEGLGEDFGINPLWLRLAFALMVFWSPVVALSLYLGLGVVVLASRLAFPERTRATAETAALVAADNDDIAEQRAEAA